MTLRRALQIQVVADMRRLVPPLLCWSGSSPGGGSLCALTWLSSPLLPGRAGWQRRGPAGQPQSLRAVQQGQQQRERKQREQLLQRLGEQLRIRLGDGEQLERE